MGFILTWHAAELHVVFPSLNRALPEYQYITVQFSYRQIAVHLWNNVLLHKDKTIMTYDFKGRRSTIYVKSF